VRVGVPKYQPREHTAPPTPRPAVGAIKGRRQASFNGTMIDATLYERDGLDIGATVAGPAIIEQFDATTVIPPGWNGQVDGYANLILVRA
jgi:N-methylhydantoinase A